MVRMSNLPTTKERRKRIALVTASPMTISAFMTRHIYAWADRCDVTLFSNFSDDSALFDVSLPATLRPIMIERKVSVWKDFLALLCLTRQLKQGHFDAVISLTPKAGLLAMLAGWVSRTPLRIHIFTGQVWAARVGVSRWFLKRLDSLTAHLATEVLADSESQRQFLISEDVVTAARSAVIGCGSVSGVDGTRFRPDPLARIAIRKSLRVSDQDTLLLFLGRLNPDKGILDLGAAFVGLSKIISGVHLLVVGSDEASMRRLLKSKCHSIPDHLHFIEHTVAPETYMAAADILCLPSYREGFGTVVIEAAAVGVPAVASRIYGLTDAIVDGETGLLHAPGDIEELQRHLELLIRDPIMRDRLGVSARERALEDFAADEVTRAVAKYIFKRLKLNG